MYVKSTIVVKSWQLLQSNEAIVGDMYPNHFLDIKRKSDEETAELTKECIAGKHDVQSAVVK
eukprot:5087750-Ditylum_brightwellii.AAC.1